MQTMPAAVLARSLPKALFPSSWLTHHRSIVWTTFRPSVRYEQRPQSLPIGPQEATRVNSSFVIGCSIKNWKGILFTMSCRHMLTSAAGTPPETGALAAFGPQS